MDDKIKDFWAGKSREEVEQTYDKAMTVMFAIEFLAVVGIYMLLKNYASTLAAELWMLIAYGVALKGSVDLLSASIKSRVMEKCGHGEEKATIEKEDAKVETTCDNTDKPKS